MSKVSAISSLLKKNHRDYTSHILRRLAEKGYTDLRVSFLDIIIYLTDNDGSSIRDIGKSCALKKQTMTTHINELEKRGYITRKIGEEDKREQKIFLTHYGQNFKFSLREVVAEVEQYLTSFLGEVELERLLANLEKLDSLFKKMAKS